MWVMEEACRVVSSVVSEIRGLSRCPYTEMSWRDRFLHSRMNSETRV